MNIKEIGYHFAILSIVITTFKLDTLAKCGQVKVGNYTEMIPMRDGIELVEKLGVIGTLDGYIALARVKQAQGQLQEAEQVMETVHRIATRFDASELDDLLVDLQRAQLWIAQGKVEAAARWHSEWVEQKTKIADSMPYILRELDQILQARI